MYMYAYFLVMYVCVSCNDVVMLVDIGIIMWKQYVYHLLIQLFAVG